LPGELFDSVAENLLQNALAKAHQLPALRISVSFQPDAGGRLTICDTGKAIPQAVAACLFATPVPSQNGLGIGLYQAAKQAERIRRAEGFPADVGDALLALAEGDVAGYEAAARSVLASFETRIEYLEDIPVADTVLALQVLAAQRGLAVSLRSPLLPA